MSVKASTIQAKQVSDNMPVAYFDEERKVYELFVMGGVYGYSWYLEYLNEAAKMGYALEIHIMSFGGSAFEGTGFYDFVKKHFADNSTAYIYGIAASAATAIACGCTKTYIGAGAMYGIHNPYNMNGSDNALTAGLTEIYAQIYANRTGMSVEECKALMQKGTDEEYAMRATEAIELGFCDGLLSDEVNALLLNLNITEMENTFLKGLSAFFSGKTEEEKPVIEEAPKPEEKPAVEAAMKSEDIVAKLDQILAETKTANTKTAELEAKMVEMEKEYKAGLELVSKETANALAKMGKETPAVTAVPAAPAAQVQKETEQNMDAFEASFFAGITKPEKK